MQLENIFHVARNIFHLTQNKFINKFIKKKKKNNNVVLSLIKWWRIYQINQNKYST